jgi:hypothetical protein
VRPRTRDDPGSIIGTAHASTRLFAAVVDEHSLAGQDPVEVAFEHVCRQFDRFLQREYLNKRPERGLLILASSRHHAALRSRAREHARSGHGSGAVRHSRTCRSSSIRARRD